MDEKAGGRLRGRIGEGKVRAEVSGGMENVRGGDKVREGEKVRGEKEKT